MKEDPKIKYNLSYLSNVENDIYLKNEIKKNYSFKNAEKLTERIYNNLLGNKIFSNSIFSSIILTQNNISSSDINNKKNKLKDNISDENSIIKSKEIQKMKNDLLDLNNKNCQAKNNIQNLKKIVYHKKSISNYSNIHNKEKMKKTKINNINFIKKENNYTQENIFNFNYSSNNSYDMRIKLNDKIKEFNDLTLNEYLKKEIENMKNYHNKINLSDNSKNEKLYKNIISEETKINTL